MAKADVEQSASDAVRPSAAARPSDQTPKGIDFAPSTPRCSAVLEENRENLKFRAQSGAAEAWTINSGRDRAQTV